MLTTVSKALNFIPHELIIAKLEASGFHVDALIRESKLMTHIVFHRGQYLVLYYSKYTYLTHSTFWKILQAMSMILQFIRVIKRESVISVLETSSSLLFKWFHNNFAIELMKKSFHNKLWRSTFSNGWSFAHWFQENNSFFWNKNQPWLLNSRELYNEINRIHEKCFENRANRWITIVRRIAQ